MLLTLRELFRNIVAYALLPVFIIIIGISFFLVYKIVFVTKDFRFWNKVKLGLSTIVIFSAILLGYGYLWERNIIEISNHTIVSKTLKTKKKFAVIADLHLGIWKDQNYLTKVVDKINSIENLDYLLVAGDWTYHPNVIDLTKLFEPLKGVRVPVYGVLGNHDVEQPGEPYRAELLAALEKDNVKIIDEKYLDLGDFVLAGLGDRWGGEDDSNFLTQTSSRKPLVVIAHNPDSVRSYNVDSTKEVLTVTGHTHCGQIRIPFLYKLALPVEDSYFDKGWYDYNFESKKWYEVKSQNPILLQNNLFITCGTGEVGMPIRLFNPPIIDVIEILPKN